MDRKGFDDYMPNAGKWDVQYANLVGIDKMGWIAYFYAA